MFLFRLLTPLLCLLALSFVGAQALHCSPSERADDYGAELIATHSGGAGGDSDHPCDSDEHCCHTHSLLVLVIDSSDRLASRFVASSTWWPRTDAVPESPARAIDYPPQLA